MAIYHLTVKNGNKGNGLNHAKYIEREDKYANRSDLEYKYSANLPEFANGDEKVFWLEADKHERANGRVYKEIEFSLPSELTQEQRIELAHEFANNVLGSQHAYTFAIHSPKDKNGIEQPHVHLMFCERTNDGFKRTAEQFFSRANPDKKWLGGAKKNRIFTHQSFIYEVRKEWARTANHYLEKHGYDVRIDERSYKDRGIDLLSQNVKYYHWNASEEVVRKFNYEATAQFKEAQRINGQKIIENPQVVLEALTSNQSTFQQKDLEKFIFNHTDGEDQYRNAYNAVITHPSFKKLTGTNQYTSLEMYVVERDIVDRVDKIKHEFLDVDTEHKKDSNEAFLQQAIISSLTFKEEQKEAFLLMTSNKSMTSVNGSAGTGKSYVLKAVNDFYDQAGHDVYGIALQNTNVQAMRDDGIKNANTIYSFLKAIEKDEIKLNENSVIIVEEAGLVGSRDMQKIIKHAQDNNAKIRMVGDSFQLNAVSAGNAYETVQQYLVLSHQRSLTEIVRQKDAEMRVASEKFSRHKTLEGLEVYEKLNKIQSYDTQDMARVEMVKDWYKDKTVSKLMLAYTNLDVKALNDYARMALKADNKLAKEDYMIKVVDQKADKINSIQKSFAEGDKLFFKENNKNLGIKKGEFGMIEKIHYDDVNQKVSSIDVKFKEDKAVNIDIEKYQSFDHGYAMTIHKSQGQTVDSNYVLSHPTMDAKLTYVAMTRHREDAKIYYSKEQFEDIKAFKEKLSKSNKKEFGGSFGLDASFDRHREKQVIDKRLTLAEKYHLTTPKPTESDIVKHTREVLQDTNKLGKREFTVGQCKIKVSTGDYINVYENKTSGLINKNHYVSKTEYKIDRYEFDKGKTYLHCKTTSTKHPEKMVKIDPEKVRDIEYATYKYRGHYHEHKEIKIKTLEKFYKSYAEKNQASLQQNILNSRANLQKYLKQQKTKKMKLANSKGLRIKI